MKSYISDDDNNGDNSGDNSDDIDGDNSGDNILYINSINCLTEAKSKWYQDFINKIKFR